MCTNPDQMNSTEICMILGPDSPTPHTPGLTVMGGGPENFPRIGGKETTSTADNGGCDISKNMQLLNRGGGLENWKCVSEGCPQKDQAGDYGNTSTTLQECAMAKPLHKNSSLHLLDG